MKENNTTLDFSSTAKLLDDVNKTITDGLKKMDEISKNTEDEAIADQLFLLLLNSALLADTKETYQMAQNALKSKMFNNCSSAVRRFITNAIEERLSKFTKKGK